MIYFKKKLRTSVFSGESQSQFAETASLKPGKITF
jgi:hypothetical protein